MAQADAIDLNNKAKFEVNAHRFSFITLTRLQLAEQVPNLDLNEIRLSKMDSRVQCVKAALAWITHMKLKHQQTAD